MSDKLYKRLTEQNGLSHEHALRVLAKMAGKVPMTRLERKAHDERNQAEARVFPNAFFREIVAASQKMDAEKKTLGSNEGEK